MDGVDVTVRVLYSNDCPPGTTCAPIGGGAKAEMWLDGRLWNTTTDFGDGILHGVVPGPHVLCAHHKDLGNDTKQIEAGADGTVQFLLHRHSPPCP